MPGHAHELYQPRLVAGPAEHSGSPPELFLVRSDGRGVRLRQGVQEPRPQRRDQGPAGLDDEFAGPGGRPTSATMADCSSAWRGTARARIASPTAAAAPAPASSASRRSTSWPDNAEPRQGAPAAVADQAEIRPQNLLGRPDDPRRQRRAQVDGLQDVRFRRRPRRCLGARRALLGSRGDVAGRRTLQRRTPARRAARRRADGPDLRQPGRAERQSGPGRGGEGHPRDVLPHGDERRGDRRADRRRPHLRQDPRRGRSVADRSGAGRRRHRGSGPRLEEQVRHRRRGRRHHRRPGSHLVADADEVEQPLLRQPVQDTNGS